MATTVHIPVEEYLSKEFQDRNPEYVDGELVERALPTYKHGKIQLRFGWIFGNARRRHPLFATSEARLRVTPARVRVPDVAVFAGSEPEEDYPDHPPLVIVEILSPTDAWTSVMDRLREFEEWGVRHLWLVDPSKRRFHVFSNGDIRTVATLDLPEYEISIRPEDLF
jgi:Uma2 family endonuclease